MSDSLGWCFVAIAGLFLLGLLPAFAARFYPQSVGVVPRAAAPVLFALLSMACFSGFGLWALGLIALGGGALVVLQRRRDRVEEPAARREPVVLTVAEDRVREHGDRQLVGRVDQQGGAGVARVSHRSRR